MNLQQIECGSYQCRRRRYCYRFCYGGVYVDSNNYLNYDSLCPNGKYAPKEKCKKKSQTIPSVLCKNCSAGYFSIDQGSKSCISCPYGKYQNYVGKNSCYNINVTCNELSGFVNGQTKNKCTECHKIEKIKYKGNCIDCEDRFYFNSAFNKCLKIKLYKEPLFWILIVIIGLLIFSFIICIQNKSKYSIIIGLPLFIPCTVVFILYCLYEINNTQGVHFSIGLGVLLYFSIMVIMLFCNLCNKFCS